MIPTEYMKAPAVKLRARFDRKAAERHARLGLLAADASYRGGDIDARTSREDFRAALDVIRTGSSPVAEMQARCQLQRQARRRDA